MSASIHSETLTLYTEILKYATKPCTIRRAALKFNIETSTMRKHFKRLIAANCIIENGIQECTYRNAVTYRTISLQYNHVVVPQDNKQTRSSPKKSIERVIQIAPNHRQYNLMDYTRPYVERNHRERNWVSGSILSAAV